MFTLIIPEMFVHHTIKKNVVLVTKMFSIKKLIQKGKEAFVREMPKLTFSRQTFDLQYKYSWFLRSLIQYSQYAKHYLEQCLPA